MAFEKIKDILIIAFSIIICVLYLNYAFEFFKEFSQYTTGVPPIYYFTITGIIALVFAYWRFCSLKKGKKEHVLRISVFFCLLAPTIMGPEIAIVPFIMGGFLPICIYMTFLENPFIQFFAFAVAISLTLAITSLQTIVLSKIIKNRTEQ